MALPDASQVTYLVDPGGRTVTVPHDQVAQAQSLGYSPASPEDIKKFNDQVTYGSGIVNPVKAGTAAAARTATFGLSDQALTKTGLVAPETLRGLEQANPIADTIGTGIGVVAPALVGDEAGVLGALNPIKAVSKLGQAAEGAAAAVLPAAGESLASRILATAAPKAVGSAVEGALYSAGHEVSEEALGDPNQTAESVLAHIGLGGLLGGGLGGALGVAEVAIPEYVTKAKDLMSDVYGAAKKKLGQGYTSELGSKLTGTAADTAQVLSENTGKLADMESAFPGMPEAVSKLDPQSAKYLIDNYEKVITDPKARVAMAQEMTKGMQSVIDEAQRVMRKTNGELAPKEAEALLEGADAHVTAKAYEQLHDQVSTAVNQMREEPELFDQSTARALEQIRDGLVRDVDHTLSPVDTYERLRTLKQQLDEHINFGKPSINMGISERKSMEMMRALRSEVKNTLTNPDVFGELAARRAALDSAQAEWLSLTKQGGDFNKKFLTKKVSKGGSGWEVKETKLNTWLNQMGDARGQAAAEAWGRTMEAARSLVDEAEKSFRSAPVGEFDRSALDSLLKKTQGITQDAQERASVTQMVNQLNPRGHPWGSNAVAAGDMTGMVHKGLGAIGIGAVAHNPLLAVPLAAGKAVAGLKEVGRTYATLGALERIAQKASKAVDSGVNTLVKGGVKASYIGRGEVAAGFAAHISKSYDDQAKAYARSTDRVLNLASNFDAAHASISSSTSALAPHAPNTADALSVAQVRALNFLASKVPKHNPTGMLSPKWKPTPSEMGKWNRYQHVVHKPLSVLKMAAAGSLQPEHVETLAAVYPETLAKIQKQIIASMPKDPSKVPYKSRKGLSMLLGTPLDGSTNPDSIRANQAAFASASQEQQQQQQQPSLAGASKLTIGSRLLTPMQSSAEREA